MWVGESLECRDDGYTMAEVKKANFNKSCVYTPDPVNETSRVVAFFRDIEVTKLIWSP